MVDATLKDLWIPAGLLLGFQVTLLKWRIEQEAQVGDRGDIPWLVPADYVGILGMLFFVGGTVLLPLAGAFGVEWAKFWFGLGTLSFLAQALGLAGHYQLFNRTKTRRFMWCSEQEFTVLLISLVVAVTYTFYALPR